MIRRREHNRRLVGFYDKQDRLFYFRVQVWDGKTYQDKSHFETERAEVNGLKDQHESEE